MRIDSATIGMDSARTYRTSTAQFQSFSFRAMQSGLMDVNKDNTTKKATDGTTDAKENEEVEADNEDRGLDLQNRYQAMIDKLNASSTKSQKDSIFEIKQQCLQYLFELIFNKKPGYTTRDGLIVSGEDSSTTSSSAQNYLQSQTGFTGTMQFVASNEYFYEESESTSFETTGTVKTADGREISFNLSLEMSRSFSEYYKESYGVTAINLCDPLVINLNGNIADVSDQKFMFDLDADGKEDSISRLGSGSGFLALDKNKDGKINDGNELFGTKSGDGFSDLSLYDEDGNGWIDENDSIWNELKVWTQDEDGNDELYTLKEAGVGAICLKKASTDFYMNDEENKTNAVIRNTGVFLYENGNVGTVQHLDLAK